MIFHARTRFSRGFLSFCFDCDAPSLFPQCFLGRNLLVAHESTVVLSTYQLPLYSAQVISNLKMFCFKVQSRVDVNGVQGSI
mmetsp:Transcript_3456/g.6055  ORF Transcript_3456/g.6055 Transcript_3456/m.6055 type:complete len:82 (-) Transcript_3456:268-513(-)